MALLLERKVDIERIDANDRIVLSEVRNCIQVVYQYQYQYTAITKTIAVLRNRIITAQRQPGGD